MKKRIFGIATYGGAALGAALATSPLAIAQAHTSVVPPASISKTRILPGPEIAVGNPNTHANAYLRWSLQPEGLYSAKATVAAPITYIDYVTPAANTTHAVICRIPYSGLNLNTGATWACSGTSSHSDSAGGSSVVQDFGIDWGAMNTTWAAGSDYDYYVVDVLDRWNIEELLHTGIYEHYQLGAACWV